MSSMRLYNVDVEYVKKLHDIDSEVFYSNNYNTKPYVGIVIIQDRYNYFYSFNFCKTKTFRLAYKNKYKLPHI